MSDLRLSWSRHQTAETCPWKYHLKYDKGKKSKKPTAAALLIGGAVHHGIEQWSQAGYTGSVTDYALAYFDESAATLKSRSQSRNRVSAAAFHAEEIYRRLEVPRHGLVEYTVAADLDKATQLYGIIDLYMPNTQTIYDMKVTTPKSKYEPDTRQLLMYALILGKMGQPVREVGFILPLYRPDQQVVTYPVTAEQLADFERKIAESAQRIHGRDLKAPKKRRGDHCRWCEWNETEDCPPIDLVAFFKGKRK